MKKVLLVLTALFAAAAVTFAAAPEVKLGVAVAGSASATLGYDLDNSDAGISNAIGDNKITVTFVPEATDSKGGEGVYGWIQIENFKSTAENGAFVSAAGTVTAKLYINAIYIDITSADNKVDAASLSFGGTVLANGTNAVSLDPAEEKQGIAIGLKDETKVKFVAGIASKYVWDNATHPVNNNWNAYAKVGLGSDIVKGLSANVKVAGEGSTGNMAIGFDAAYDVAPIVAGIGFDYFLPKDTAIDPTMELSVKAQYKVAGAATKFTPAGGAEVEYQPGVAASAIINLSGTAEADVAATFFDADLVKDADIVLSVEASNVLSDMDLGLGVLASYNIAASKIKVGASLTQKTLFNVDPVTKANVYAEYTGIANTSIKADYTSGDLTAATAVLGNATLTLKVSY